MADEADKAQDEVDMIIANALKRLKPSLKPTGYCHFCNEPAEGLFCSTECRDDAERLAAARVRAGR